MSLASEAEPTRAGASQEDSQAIGELSTPGPAEKVDEIQDVLHDQCQGCGHCLPTQIEQVQTVGEPQRHQVTELPAMKVQVTEYRLHVVSCDHCGAITRAVLPPEVSFGRQLSAPVAYLTVVLPYAASRTRDCPVAGAGHRD